MESAPRRRWFRLAFSLRSLFIVVTIFGVWLGWQVKIVRERKAILADIYPVEENRKHVCNTLEALERNSKTATASLFGGYEYEYCRVSRVRRLLGDETYLTLWLSQRTCSPSQIEKVESAFPETQLFVTENAAGQQIDAFRDSLCIPSAHRLPNRGSIFKTGLIEK